MLEMTSKPIKNIQKSTVINRLRCFLNWLRKLGDSNPRYGYPYGSLANCWFQPLTQTSKCSAYGNRTRVSAVRGPRPGPLDESAISVETKSGSWGIRTPGTVTRTAV